MNNSTSFILKILLKAGALYLLWAVGYHGWLQPDGRLDTILTTHVGQMSNIVLNLAGYSSTFRTEAGKAYVELTGHSWVWIDHPCNGLVLMAIFAGLIAVYPGDWRKKLLMIPAGIFGIYVINVIRVAVLCVNYSYFPGTFQFNHKYTYSFIVYAFIFGLWMLWVNKFGKDQPGAEKQEKAEKREGVLVNE